MRLTLRALSALLQYPSPGLREHLGEVRDALASERALPARALRGLGPLLDRLERDDLLDSQSEYSDLFDRSRALSLNLFEHVHGESRERGQAMIDLRDQYAAAGIFLDSRELPDFVPAFLEYASCLPLREALETLSEPAHVFAALAERLDGRGSDYAAVFHALVAAGRARPDAAALEELRARAPEESPETLDADWEEAPVTFGTLPHEMGGPTGPSAKARALCRAAGAALKG